MNTTININAVGQEKIFNGIFLLCCVVCGVSAIVFAVITILFVNNLINLPVFCAVVFVLAAAFASLIYFILRKIFVPVNIRTTQSQEIQAIGYLAGGFVLEYNNMFATALGAAEVLQQNASKENEEYINIIISTVKRASNLTNRLFGAARKTKIEMITIDMHELMHSVIKILMKNCTPNVRFIEDFQANNWNIAGNRQQIKNALISLGANAVEAIGTKAGTIYFRTQTSSFSEKTDIGIFTVEAGNYLVISIEDTESSISFEQMKTIFDPSFVSPQTCVGVNIRLASVLSAVSQHKGAIIAENKGNFGSAFRIYLPFSTVGRDNEILSEDALLIDAVRQNKSGGSFIMVVDDDSLVRKVVTAMLNRMGYSVICAESGFDAIEIYGERQQEISLVILDMIMPNIDGVSCFYELKKINSAVKVLVSSGYIDDYNIENMKKDGLCGSISKPYSYEELEKTVANAMQI